MFKVGDEVLCVDDYDIEGIGIPIEVGRVYTVRSQGFIFIGIDVDEYPNDPHWRRSRFIPWTDKLKTNLRKELGINV